jgi:hypothetical protein
MPGTELAMVNELGNKTHATGITIYVGQHTMSRNIKHSTSALRSWTESRGWIQSVGWVVGRGNWGPGMERSEGVQRANSFICNFWLFSL